VRATYGKLLLHSPITCTNRCQKNFFPRYDPERSFLRFQGNQSARRLRSLWRALESICFSSISEYMPEFVRAFVSRCIVNLKSCRTMCQVSSLHLR
jgi:hypothetical protein